MIATHKTEFELLGDASHDPGLLAAAADAVQSLQSRVPDLTLPRKISWRTYPERIDPSWLEVSMTDDPQVATAAVSRRFAKEMMKRPDTRDSYHLQVFGDILALRTLRQRELVERLLLELTEEERHGDGG